MLTARYAAGSWPTARRPSRQQRLLPHRAHASSATSSGLEDSTSGHGWTLTRVFQALGRRLHGGIPQQAVKSRSSSPAGASSAPAPRSPGPPAAAPTPLPDSCPIDCLPSTPIDIIRSLAPERLTTAAAAVHSALRSDAASAHDVKRALQRLRGHMSPEAWEAFTREVEHAALRAALQHPPAGFDVMATLGSVGASWFEDESDVEDDGDGLPEGSSSSSVGSMPLVVGTGVHPKGHHHLHPYHHQQPSPAPASTSSLHDNVGPIGAWAPQGESQSYGGWSTFFKADNIRQAALSAADHRGPTFIGAHPVTILPAFDDGRAAVQHIGTSLDSPTVTATTTAAAQSSTDVIDLASGARTFATSPDSPMRSSTPSSKRRSASHTPRKSPRSTRPPHFSHLVFGGGGARTLAYAGAVHALRTLGLVRRLESVAGASGGAILAVLAAVGFGAQEVLVSMASLPDAESLSWMGLNRNLGLASGAELFGAIEQAVAERTGVPEPTLGDVEAFGGVRVFIATTSLAKRAPLYLDSRAHAGMRVRDALKASAAIPFFFSPVRSPFAKEDFLVDGCLTDCTPVGAILGSGNDGDTVDPASVLVLAVHDAAGSSSGSSVAADLNGLVNGLVATALQAGFHHTLRSGVRVLNLFDAVANVDPLQFRMHRTQGRDVVAKAQALTEKWAVELYSGAQKAGPTPTAAAPAMSPATGSSTGSGTQNVSCLAGKALVAGAAGLGVKEDVITAAGAGSVGDGTGGAAAALVVGIAGAVAAAGDVARGGGAAPAVASSPGKNALLSSMGGGGGGAGAYVDAAGQQLGYGCDCHPWWLASLDEGIVHSSETSRLT